MTQLIISVSLGGVLALLGALLGAFLMYKVMRQVKEPHKTFFGNVPQGDMFSIDDWGEHLEHESIEEEKSLPEDIQERTDEFVDQFAERLGEVNDRP